MQIQQIVAKDGSVIFTGKPGQLLLPDFVGRCKAVGGKVKWGDHYRALTRRKDPPELFAKCKQNGESLRISTPSL